MDAETLVAELDAGVGAYVECLPAGTQVKGEFMCSDCAYGVIVTRTLPPCPMCGGVSWERSAWSPFARSRAQL